MGDWDPPTPITVAPDARLRQSGYQIQDELFRDLMLQAIDAQYPWAVIEHHLNSWRWAWTLV